MSNFEKKLYMNDKKITKTDFDYRKRNVNYSWKKFSRTNVNNSNFSHADVMRIQDEENKWEEYIMEDRRRMFEQEQKWMALESKTDKEWFDEIRLEKKRMEEQKKLNVEIREQEKIREKFIDKLIMIDKEKERQRIYLQRFYEEQQRLFEEQERRWGNLEVHEVYTNNQSVHDSKIQKNVKLSIFSLLNDDKDLTDFDLKKFILKNPNIDYDTRSILFTNINSIEIHSVLNVSFKDVLKKVLLRIDSNETSKLDLYQRLKEEMMDSKGMCFTGRLSRLVNVLVGFYDDIKVEMTGDSHIISMVIADVKKRCDLTDNDDLTEESKNLIRQKLKQLDYTDDIIEQWINI